MTWATALAMAEASKWQDMPCHHGLPHDVGVWRSSCGMSSVHQTSVHSQSVVPWNRRLQRPLSSGLEPGLSVGFSASSALAASRMAACCCSVAVRPRRVLAVALMSSVCKGGRGIDAYVIVMIAHHHALSAPGPGYTTFVMSAAVPNCIQCSNCGGLSW